MRCWHSGPGSNRQRHHVEARTSVDGWGRGLPRRTALAEEAADGRCARARGGNQNVLRRCRSVGHVRFTLGRGWAVCAPLYRKQLSQRYTVSRRRNPTRLARSWHTDAHRPSAGEAVRGVYTMTNRQSYTDTHAHIVHANINIDARADAHADVCGRTSLSENKRSVLTVRTAQPCLRAASTYGIGVHV
jgi:hypothetical protein